MDGKLANILSWQKPVNSAIALISLNLVFWFLFGERPIFIVSLLLLAKEILSLWRDRIRPEVLVDPPDNESWTTIESYDMKHRLILLSSRAISSLFNLRQRNHFMFSFVCAMIFYVIGKLGTMIYLRTLILLVGNIAFFIGPILSIFPDPLLNPASVTPESSPVLDELVPDESSPDLWLPSPARSSPEPESLTPFVSRMPDHTRDLADEDFHFDPNHFDSSSSTSSSTSFEIIGSI